MVAITNRAIAFRRSDHRAGRGFTLAEILVALGIMAIGMAMVAAIFPAALAFNKSSTNDTRGMIICENGFTLSEGALTTKIVDKSAPTLLTVLADEATESVTIDSIDVKILDRNKQHYPTGESDVRTGFVMMARNGGGSVYQLVTVAYRKTDKTHLARAMGVTCTVSGKNVTVSSGKLKIGSPLINRKNGEFMIIDSMDTTGTKGTLNANRPTTAMSDGNQFYIIAERSSSNGDISELRQSPAIQTMSKVTGLKQR